MTVKWRGMNVTPRKRSGCGPSSALLRDDTEIKRKDEDRYCEAYTKVKCHATGQSQLTPYKWVSAWMGFISLLGIIRGHNKFPATLSLSSPHPPHLPSISFVVLLTKGHAERHPH